MGLQSIVHAQASTFFERIHLRESSFCTHVSTSKFIGGDGTSTVVRRGNALSIQTHPSTIEDDRQTRYAVWRRSPARRVLRF